MLLLPLFYLLLGIDQYSLLNENEGRYAEIAREMLARGDFIIPHLNGLPYLEKPPLLYYLTALSFSIFGINDVAARLVPIGASMLSLFTLVWFGRAIGRPLAGLFAALALGSSLGFVLLGNVLMTDALYNALLCSALLVAYVGLIGAERRLLCIAYGLLALAVLAKGLVALVLFYLVLLPMALFPHAQGRMRWLRRLFSLWPLLVFAALALPWHIAAALKMPEFSWFYFINEHVYRFTGQRMPHDYFSGGSPFFYVPRLIFLFFPWSIVALAALLKFNIKSKTEGGHIDRADRHLSIFASLLAGVPACFFALSSSKADYYVMVALPGIALLLGLTLAKTWRARWTHLRLCLVLALFGLAFSAWQSWIYAPAGSSSFMPWEIVPAMPVAISWLVLTLAAATLFWCRRQGLAWLVIGMMFLPLKLTLLNALQSQEEEHSAHALAQYLVKNDAADNVMLYRDYELLSSLPFHLGHTIPVVDSLSPDLWFGKQLGRMPSQFPSAQSAAQATRSFILVVPIRRERELAASGLNSKLLALTQIGNTRLYRFTP